MSPFDWCLINHQSIIFVLGSELSEVYGCVTECAEVDARLLDLGFVHFVLAAFASVVVSGHYWFSAYHAGGEIGTALSAAGVVFTYVLFAISARAFDLFTRSLFGRMLCKDADGHVDVFLSLFSRAHSLKFNECARTLFVALKIKNISTLL